VGRNREGDAVPRGHGGRRCQWQMTSAAEEAAVAARTRHPSLASLHEQLKLKCEGTGAPGVFSFTPTADMPDVLFYQVII